MTQSLEDYLEMIYILIRSKKRARVRDIASALNVTMPSVIKAVAELKKVEYVTQEPYGDIELTPKGKKSAAAILGRHTLLKAFLMKLGVSEKVSEKDACIMEHFLSAETIDHIRQFTNG